VQLILIGLIGVGVAVVIGLVGGATFQAARYFQAKNAPGAVAKQRQRV
jgi:uncharacterized protein YneF (UPF0154 family)